MTFGNRKFLGFLGAATVVIIAEYVLVLSDCVISGRTLGETALGAMNLLMPVFSTVSFFTWLLAVGTSIVYSEAIGRTETERAARLAGQGVLTAAVMGVSLAGIAYCLKGPYLAYMAPDGATTAFAGQYWTWYPAVVLLESLDMVLLYLVYTDGGERACLVSYVGQVVVNVGASYCLCARIGMAGISLGTALAYVVGIGALLPRLLGKACGLRFRPYFNLRDLAHSLKASFGDASAGLFHAFLFFVVTKYALARWGAGTLPIAAVVFCIVRLTVFFNGVGIALQPLETVYHGEGNETAIARLVRFAAAVSVAEGLAISAVILVAPELVVSLVGMDDPALATAAKRAVRLTATGLPGYAIAYMLNSHYQYVGRPYRSVKLTALAFFLAPVALVGMMGAWIGLDGVWLAVATGPVCALAAFLPFLRRLPRRTPAVWMRTIRVWRTEETGKVEAQVRRLLAADGFGEGTRRKVSAAVSQALAQIGERNAGRRTRVEVSVDRREGIRAVLRDDGELFPLEGLDVPERRHVPATGFNRNVLVWPVAAVAD